MNKKIFLYISILGVLIITVTIFSANSEKHIGITQQNSSSNLKTHAIDRQQANLEQEVNSLKQELTTMNAALKHLESRFDSLSPSSNDIIATNKDFEPVPVYPEKY